MINKNILEHKVVQLNDVIIIKNKNTTLGFVNFNENGEIEYIFVNSIFRRMGIGKKLIRLTEKKLGKKLKPKEPISPLGRKLFHID